MIVVGMSATAFVLILAGVVVMLRWSSKDSHSLPEFGIPGTLFGAAEGGECCVECHRELPEDEPYAALPEGGDIYVLHCLTCYTEMSFCSSEV